MVDLCSGVELWSNARISASALRRVRTVLQAAAQQVRVTLRHGSRFESPRRRQRGAFVSYAALVAGQYCTPSHVISDRHDTYHHCIFFSLSFLQTPHLAPSSLPPVAPLPTPPGNITSGYRTLITFSSLPTTPHHSLPPLSLPQVKPNTSFSAVAAMVNGLRALIAPSSLASLSPFSPPGQPSTAPSATAAMVNCLRPHILFIPAHHFPFPLPPLHQVKPSTPSSAIAAMVNCLRPHIPLIPSPHYSPHPLLPSRQVKPNTPPSAVAAMVNGLRALSSAPGVLFLAVGSALPIPPALSASPAPPFTVKPNTPPSAVAAMVNGLRALSSAPGVLFLAVGSALPIPPALAAYTPQSPWTHALLGRYESRDALQAYAGSEEHVKVVEGCIKPIISDILAVDWETDVPADAAASASASAAADAGASRLPFSVIHSVVMELGPSATANPTAIPTMVSSLKSHVGEIPGLHEVSIGENFAPARAKGFTWGYAGYHADEAALRVYAGDERHQQVMAEAVLPLVARYNWVDFRVDEVYEETSAKL
ncbi:unnamed protein product [Closterium sp. Naga37s-1]|nr:unnamed protein product [Closterium sp. Naga37s-1]